MYPLGPTRSHLQHRLTTTTTTTQIEAKPDRTSMLTNFFHKKPSAAASSSDSTGLAVVTEKGSVDGAQQEQERASVLDVTEKQSTVTEKGSAVGAQEQERALVAQGEPVTVPVQGLAKLEKA